MFGLNTEIYGVNLQIQSEYGKIRTRKNSVFGYFSRSYDQGVEDFKLLKLDYKMQEDHHTIELGGPLPDTF